MTTFFTHLAYGGAPSTGQVLAATTEKSGGVPSWTVFVGVGSVLFVLGAVFYFFKFKNN